MYKNILKITVKRLKSSLSTIKVLKNFLLHDFKDNRYPLKINLNGIQKGHKKIVYMFIHLDSIIL